MSLSLIFNCCADKKEGGIISELGTLKKISFLYQFIRLMIIFNKVKILNVTYKETYKDADAKSFEG